MFAPVLMSCGSPGQPLICNEGFGFSLVRKVLLLSENIHNCTFKLHPVTGLNNSIMFCVFKTVKIITVSSTFTSSASLIICSILV